MTITLAELFILAVGLSMDAFAVSICKGLAMKKISLKNMAIVGLWFGLFQEIMPLFGFLLGRTFAKYVTKFAPWIGFGLLVLIGGNMVKEAFGQDEEEESDSLKFMEMLLLAIATSIDAFAVGVTFSLMKDINIYAAISFIGCVTFTISAIGVRIGSIVGGKFKNKAEFAGGVILIILGIKVLLEGIGVI